jgi:RAD54-like protein 2
MAARLGEKTLVYSKCLETLSLIEALLQSSNWKKQIGSTFPESSIGNWKKNKEYLRIDGGTDSGNRRTFVDKLNSKAEVRVFIISSVAGGIGINLVRVVRDTSIVDFDC